MLSNMGPYTLLLLGVTSQVVADGIYGKTSPVLQVTAKNYDSLIAQSNHTSIVEFYAPWCGHCKNLKPAYEKAAKNLAGLAKVAAVNCDDDENKQLCGQMGVQGFPTLKIVRPSSKRGRPTVEDYQGARSAKAIVESVVDKIPNRVTKLDDSSIEAWLGDKSTEHKVILFTDKSATSALLRALAIDYLGVIHVGQFKSKGSQAADKYGITKLPTLVLFTGVEQGIITYDGDLKKAPIIAFLKQVAEPNPDPAPKRSRPAAKKTKSATADSTTSEFSRASEAHKASDLSDHMQSSGTVVLEDNIPMGSPVPIIGDEQQPWVVNDIPKPLEILSSASALSSACFEPRSGTCVLLLLPSNDAESDSTTKALDSFAGVSAKHNARHAKLFPIYGIAPENAAADKLRTALGLKSSSHLEIVALNSKRQWWRPYAAASHEEPDVEGFIDMIKLGEGQKEKLPIDISVKLRGGTDDFVPSSPTDEPNEQVTEPLVHNEL